MKTGSQVVKLDESIFALQLYQSDLAGYLEKLDAELSRNIVAFMAWNTGVAPINRAFFAIEPHHVVDMVTVLLGYGVQGVPESGRLGFWTKAYLNELPRKWNVPLPGSARERLSGLALKQSNPRIRGRFVVGNLSDPIQTRTQFKDRT